MKSWERKCPRCGTISHMMMIHSCHGEIRHALGEPPEDAVKLGYAVDQDWDDEGEEAIRADERKRVIEEVDRLIETHIRYSFSVAKILSGNTLDELDLIRQQLNQLKGKNDTR